LCPACERFIGPADVCPYCQAESAKSNVLRILRAGSLILGLLGLGLLFLMAANREMPVTKLDRITPLMNFAYVRIRGRVSGNAYVSRTKGVPDYLSFSVHDGSGQLRVRAYREVARELAEQDRIPRRGARVDVAGSLSVPADGRTNLRLQAAKHLKIVERGKGRQ
jgi:hypothetical protein